MKRTITQRTITVFFLATVFLMILMPQDVWAKKKKIDIIVFAGQSNMMGHGDAEKAPALKKNAGYAYLPVTGKGKLSPLTEPFGRDESDGYFMNFYMGENYATGSMVTAFVNAYYSQTKTPVLAVPASMLGTGSQSWSSRRYKGVVNRTKAAKAAAKKAGYSVRHIYMVWLQGESDATAMQREADGTNESGMNADVYIKNVKSMYKKIKKQAKTEKCFVIRIPSYYGDMKDPYGTGWNTYFKKIQKAQTRLCDENQDFVMIYSKTPSMGAGYMQEDRLHITQQGLNRIGNAAGKNAGKYAKKN